MAPAHPAKLSLSRSQLCRNLFPDELFKSTALPNLNGEFDDGSSCLQQQEASVCHASPVPAPDQVAAHACRQALYCRHHKLCTCTMALLMDGSSCLQGQAAIRFLSHKRCASNNPCKHGCRHEGEASTHYSRAGGGQQAGCEPEQGF